MKTAILFALVTTVASSASSVLTGAQVPSVGRHVEDIYIARSVRLSRVRATDWCAERHTGFPNGDREDRYEFRAVATEAATGTVTSVTGATVGDLHACFGATTDSLTSSFYAEGKLNGVPLVGRGTCRTTRRGFPEAGVDAVTCQLDLSGLPPHYVGGQLTTSTIVSRELIGLVSDPPGYTQPSIATVRLWRRP